MRKERNYNNKGLNPAEDSFKNNSDFNYSLGLRYSFLSGKSIDIYYSNAVGIQDIGQLIEDKEYRLGFKLNFLY